MKKEKIMSKKEELTEVKRTRIQEGRLFNASRHCEGVKRLKQSANLPGLPRSLRSLAMTEASEDKKTGCQEDKQVNKSCHPEFISGSVHSEKWNLPWSKMLKRVQHDKFGFTLAEVLITLGIIGVVAAITIPNMVANYQKKATVAKLKEDYAMFQQAFRLARAENGDYFDNSEYTASFDKTVATFEHYLKPYLKIAKVCIPKTDTSCWTDTVALDGLTNGYASSRYSYNKSISVILLNGQTLYMWASGDGSHMQIWVNVNGLKNKAIIGKDVFVFIYYIESGTLQFRDSQAGDVSTGTREDFLNNSTYGCNKNITNRFAGTLCGALIEHDGWKISKDYPW